VVRVSVLAALVLAAAGGPPPRPWNITCRGVTPEHRVPAPARARARKIFNWYPRGAEQALGRSPVYALLFSSRGRISRDGDRLDSQSYYLHRSLFAIDARYRGRITISGRRIGRPGPRTALAFKTNGTSLCTLHAPVVDCPDHPGPTARTLVVPRGRAGSWRFVPTEIQVGRTGCFELAVRGRGLDERIRFAVPGPDYGTPGW